MDARSPEGRSSHELMQRWFVDCITLDGNPARIGAAVTKGGQVVLLCPENGTPVLNVVQSIEYQRALRQAIAGAAAHG